MKRGNSSTNPWIISPNTWWQWWTNPLGHSTWMGTCLWNLVKGADILFSSSIQEGFSFAAAGGNVWAAFECAALCILRCGCQGEGKEREGDTSNLPCDKPFCNIVCLMWQNSLFGSLWSLHSYIHIYMFSCYDIFFCNFCVIINITGFKHDKNQSWQKG